MLRDTFSDAQAADVLGRAARMQAAADFPRAGGLTLDDLKDAGAAAGISPHFVEAAARLDLPGRLAPPPFAGVPMGVERVRIVEGRLSDANWPIVIGELRHSLGGTGRDVSIGDVRGWERYPLRIVAEGAGPVTRLVATANWGPSVRPLVAVASTLGLTALLMLALAVGDGNPSVVLPLLFMAASVGAAAVTGARFRAKEARVGGKFDAALDRIASPDAGTPTAAAARAMAPLLDLEDETDGESDAPRAQSPAPAARVRA